MPLTQINGNHRTGAVAQYNELLLIHLQVLRKILFLNFHEATRTTGLENNCIVKK